MRDWLNRFNLKRIGALVGLCFLIYLGALRARALMHADACLAEHGSYDEHNDVCHHARR